MTLRVLRYVFPIVVAATATSHCAPSRAKAIREDKLVTVGYPGAVFRPNGKIAVGATFAAMTDHKGGMEDATSGPGVLGISSRSAEQRKEISDDKREVKHSLFALHPSVMYFPKDDSAFFIGAGGSYMSSKYKFSEETSGFTSLAPSYADIEYETKATYIGVPVGWAWIWENGVSLTLDVGPRVRMSRSTTYSDDGAAASVDPKKRDQTAKLLDTGESRVGLGSLFFGYSF